MKTRPRESLIGRSWRCPPPSGLAAGPGGGLLAGLRRRARTARAAFAHGTPGFLVLAIVMACAWLPAELGFAQVAGVSGDVVDTSTERPAPVAVTEEKEDTESELAPFGSNLFQGAYFSAEREDGLNPDYIIQPGDRITLQIWGAATVSDVVVVDAQGNIFIPDVGPVRVEGIRNQELTPRIREAVQRVFTQNVNVYTNLQATTPVIVFVTGFVNRPGGFAGVASDSILYFLERAGGVDTHRGSYRDIRVLRDGEQIATADLYDFLINGMLPKPQFADGDTIVVGRRGASVTAEGAVRNSFSFEIPEEGITGRDLIGLARPWANASFATVLGTRNESPFSTYIPLSELSTLELADGDQVIFEVDQVHDTMLIRVEGSHIGPSRFAVPRDTHLKDILNYIEVDPTLADIDSISLRRESIKRRQKRALDESLRRLETAVLGKSSITAEGAGIQVQEASLIADFVKRAREVEPEGILVVSKGGEMSNVLLQPNDVITIPEKTNVVQVSGEVMVPQALVYERGARLEEYIQRVGGYTERADEDKHLILRRNGEVIPIFDGSNDISIRPGDEIISMPEVPGTTVEIVRMVTDTMFKVASAAAIFISL